MAIDTDDLTGKTYKAIIGEAEKFNSDLTLQFGLLSYNCDDEKDFIHKSEKLILEMLEYDEAEVDDLFFGNPPSIQSLHKILNKIHANIANLKRPKQT